MSSSRKLWLVLAIAFVALPFGAAAAPVAGAGITHPAPAVAPPPLPPLPTPDRGVPQPTSPSGARSSVAIPTPPPASHTGRCASSKRDAGRARAARAAALHAGWSRAGAVASLYGPATGHADGERGLQGGATTARAAKVSGSASGGGRDGWHADRAEAALA